MSKQKWDINFQIEYGKSNLEPKEISKNIPKTSIRNRSQSFYSTILNCTGTRNNVGNYITPIHCLIGRCFWRCFLEIKALGLPSGPIAV